MSPARFPLPRLVWERQVGRQREPWVSDDAPAPPWIGQVSGEESIRKVLEVIEPLWLALTIAGYRIDQIVFSPAPGGSMSLDPATMQITPETGPWADVVGIERDSDPGLTVGINIEPLADFGSGVSAWESVVPLSEEVAQAAAPGQVWVILRESSYSHDMIAWLGMTDGGAEYEAHQMSVVAVTLAIDDFVGKVIDDIVTAVPSVAEAPDMDREAGLVTMYDPTTWRLHEAAGDAEVGVDYPRRRYRALADVFWAEMSGSEAAWRAFLVAETTSRTPRSPSGPPWSVRAHLDRIARGEGEADNPTGLETREAHKMVGRWYVEARGIHAAVYPELYSEEGAVAPFDYSEAENFTWTEVLLDMQDLGAIDFVAVLADSIFARTNAALEAAEGRDLTWDEALTLCEFIQTHAQEEPATAVVAKLVHSYPSLDLAVQKEIRRSLVIAAFASYPEAWHVVNPDSPAEVYQGIYQSALQTLMDADAAAGSHILTVMQAIFELDSPEHPVHGKDLEVMLRLFSSSPVSADRGGAASYGAKHYGPPVSLARGLWHDLDGFEWKTPDHGAWGFSAELFTLMCDLSTDSEGWILDPESHAESLAGLMGKSPLADLSAERVGAAYMETVNATLNEVTESGPLKDYKHCLVGLSWYSDYSGQPEFAPRFDPEAASAVIGKLREDPSVGEMVDTAWESALSAELGSTTIEGGRDEQVAWMRSDHWHAWLRTLDAETAAQNVKTEIEVLTIVSPEDVEEMIHECLGVLCLGDPISYLGESVEEDDLAEFFQIVFEDDPESKPHAFDWGRNLSKAVKTAKPAMQAVYFGAMTLDAFTAALTEIHPHSPVDVEHMAQAVKWLDDRNGLRRSHGVSGIFSVVAAAFALGHLAVEWDNLSTRAKLVRIKDILGGFASFPDLYKWMGREILERYVDDLVLDLGSGVRLTLMSASGQLSVIDELVAFIGHSAGAFLAAIATILDCWHAIEDFQDGNYVGTGLKLVGAAASATVATLSTWGALSLVVPALAGTFPPGAAAVIIVAGLIALAATLLDMTWHWWRVYSEERDFEDRLGALYMELFDLPGEDIEERRILWAESVWITAPRAGTVTRFRLNRNEYLAKGEEIVRYEPPSGSLILAPVGGTTTDLTIDYDDVGHEFSSGDNLVQLKPMVDVPILAPVGGKLIEPRYGADDVVDQDYSLMLVEYDSHKRHVLAPVPGTILSLRTTGTVEKGEELGRMRMEVSSP